MSATKAHVIVVTGLSGSGKSTAIKAFEDIDYFCIDNLPVPLLGSFLELCERDMPDMKRIALGIDIRERKFLKDYNKIFSVLEDAGYRFEIIFLEAGDEILQRRYSQTRRIHPAAPSERKLLQAIDFEREQLRALRRRATRIIDTGDLSVHELKRFITRAYSYADENEQLSIQILSFGYKYGVPLEADLMMDVRFLPNPYFIESLRDLDGSSDSVRSWVLQWNTVQEFLADYSALLLKILPSYIREGKRYLTIALGCTGGRHRSVVIAEGVADRLRQNDFHVTLFHRDINLK
jgi:UPF0042 nucleotide-binding protein